MSDQDVPLQSIDGGKLQGRTPTTEAIDGVGIREWITSLFLDGMRIVREHIEANAADALDAPANETGTSGRGPTGGCLVAETSDCHPEPWTVARLVKACRRKGILYDESFNLTVHRGLMASYGRTTLIRIRASLGDDEKVAEIAHQLGHIALQQTQDGPEGPMLALFSEGASKQEQAADIWAAHLLVHPQTYVQVKAVHATRGEVDDAFVIAETARRLNIPARLVAVWAAHRDAHFDDDPLTWLDHD